MSYCVGVRDLQPRERGPHANNISAVAAANVAGVKVHALQAWSARKSTQVSNLCPSTDLHILSAQSWFDRGVCSDDAYAAAHRLNKHPDTAQASMAPTRPSECTQCTCDLGKA